MRHGTDTTTWTTRIGSALIAMLIAGTASAQTTKAPQVPPAAQAKDLPDVANGAAREILGAGDTIRVTVFQNPDLTTEARLSEQGTIQYPLVGEVELAGESPSGAAAQIANRLKKGGFVRNPQVTVAILQVRSRQVSVLGQVARPGRYPLEGASARLTDMLALAGGATAAADDRITLILNRDGKAVRQDIDIASMVRKGDLSTNVEVQHGDVIYVQRAPVFYIYGEVQRPGSYRLEPGNLLMHALSVGGGLTPRGTERGLKIHRRKADGSLQKLDATVADRILPDDVIYVKESWF